MKQKLLSLLVTLVCLMTGVGSAWAQTYKGAKYENGKKYYVMNVGNNSFVSGENTTSMDIKDALIFTCKVTTNNEYLYTDNENRALRADKSGMDEIPREIAGSGRRLRITQRSNTNGDYWYYIKSNAVVLGTEQVGGFLQGDGPYLGEDGKRNLNNKSNGKDNNAYTWRLLPVTEATMTINGSIGTFCAPFDVTIPSGVTAYTYTEKSGDYAIFTSIDNGTITAGTPVLTKGTQPENNVFYGYATANGATCGSGFVGNLGVAKTAETGSYVLYNGEFHPVGSNVTIGTNKCYFKSGALSAKTRIMFVDSNEETAISAASSVEPKVSAIYSVSGAAITKMQKGVNIVKYSDGTTKKVLVK